MMIRRWLLVIVLVATALVNSCTALPAQPVATAEATALPAQPVATAEATALPAQPVATAEATALPAQPVATAEATAQTEPVPAPTEAATPSSSNEPLRVDMDAIFPRGEGRELLLRDCTNCHSFVPMAIAQKSREDWESNALWHREQLPRVSDEEYDAIYEYLIENFGPDHVVPELPQVLLDAWSSY
jgi:hypothetical protein